MLSYIRKLFTFSSAWLHTESNVVKRNQIMLVRLPHIGSAIIVLLGLLLGCLWTWYVSHGIYLQRSTCAFNLQSIATGRLTIFMMPNTIKQQLERAVVFHNRVPTDYVWHLFLKTCHLSWMPISVTTILMTLPMNALSFYFLWTKWEQHIRNSESINIFKSKLDIFI